MSDRRERERLIAGINEEIRMCAATSKKLKPSGDAEIIRIAQQDIAALQDQRQQAQDSRDSDSND